MRTIRKSQDRGYADHQWLQSYHSFSFADYYDPKHMGHSVLRVINEDTIAPGAGFPMHSHRDMEIITYVYEGTIAHKDSLGNSDKISHGEIQAMSAGTGIKHSEYNPSNTEATKLLQIWIIPERQGFAPGYKTTNLKEKFKTEDLHLIASCSGANNSLPVHQDLKLYAAHFKSDRELTLPLSASRNGWIQLIDGKIKLGDQVIEGGDAFVLSKEESPQILILGEAHFLFFDLP